jgi:hypothetical protein
MEWYYQNRESWKEKVGISDDLILYMIDTLEWIPSFNPVTKENGKGLVYHGVTIINRESSSQLKAIIESWVNLFSQGPDLINLCGQTVGKEDERGEVYFEVERIKMSKKDIMQVLNELIKLSSRTIDGEYLIMHVGI